MIEPPSVPDSSTACVAIVARTWSRSRLELTASPTSRSASSSSTLRASSARRAWSSCTSLTPLIAIAAWPAKAVTIAISRSSNGLTSLRQSGQRTHDLVVEDQRRAHRGAEAGHALEVEPAVLGVGHDVGDLLGPAVEADPADEGVAIHRHRVLGDVGDRLLGHPDGLDQLVDAVVEEVEVRGVGAAQAAGALDDRGQHRVGVAGRPADRGQHLVGGVELVLERGVAASKSFVFLGADCPRGHDRVDHAASQPCESAPLDRHPQRRRWVIRMARSGGLLLLQLRPAPRRCAGARRSRSRRPSPTAPARARPGTRPSTPRPGHRDGQGHAPRPSRPMSRKWKGSRVRVIRA